MKISEKINLDLQGLIEHGPINIVAFGDSVTHGAVASNEMNYETVYWNRLKQKINSLRSYMPVNVINAGIGGICARESVPLMEKRVFAHMPDLVIICFGLNDVNGELENFLGALKTMFNACREHETDVIFMTPNMLNTYVADDTPEQYLEYAAKTAGMQTGGKMDEYIYSAVKLAKDMGVTVCDCYSAWKKLSETEDTTMLLANRINHPTKEMHKLFADMLFDIIFNNSEVVKKDESTMYRG